MQELLAELALGRIGALLTTIGTGIFGPAPVEGWVRGAVICRIERSDASAGATGILMSLSVAPSAMATASGTDEPASRAFPRTLSSVRLNTTFGRADQASATSATSPVSRSEGSVSHGGIVAARRAWFELETTIVGQRASF